MTLEASFTIVIFLWCCQAAMMTAVNDHHNDVYSTGQWLHNDMD